MSHTHHDIATDIEPVATSSRPTSTFVPPAPRRPELLPAIMQPTTPPATVDAWRPSDAIHERTTARDRAIGYNIRLIPAAVVCILLAGMGTLAFVLILRWMQTTTDALTNLFVFLLLVGVAFLMFAVSLNRVDYQHSGAGVERLRIEEAAAIERHRQADEADLRRAVIDAYLKRLED